ncbi:MAG: SAF domain-containing protein [Moorellaceae bacterium]
MTSRKVGLVISLVLSLLFTVIIVTAANRKYSEAMQPVEALKVKDFVAAGVEISPENTEVVKVPRPVSEGLATPEEAIGKTAKVSMVKGQYVYRDALETSVQLASGYVEVLVPVDLASSAYALPGHAVNVYLVGKEGEATVEVLSGIRVTRCLDSQGKAVGSSEGGIANPESNVPAVVGLEVPRDKASQVVAAASAKRVYLAKVGAARQSQ